MPHYLVSWTNPHDRLLDITLRFTAPADTPRLLLPAWRPGRYLIQNYAANVREWTAGEHRIWKEAKSAWRVDARAGEACEVTYRYYAGVLDAGSSFLDDDEVYINGSNLFMLVDGLRSEEHRLTIAAPAEWRIESQLPLDCGGIAAAFDGRWQTADGRDLPRVGGAICDPPSAIQSGSDAVQSLTARDYDHFIDSPIIAAATMTRHTFDEAGARFHMIYRDDHGFDTEQYIEPARAMIRAQSKLFGGLPFSEYRFLYHVREKWHGVEHEDSCSILLKRSALGGPEDRMLSITAHELFHAWNVKRMLPAKFHPYDYWNETPTRLLWAMEGMTSYYGDLSLVRGGVWSEARYLEHLRKEIETLEGLPARLHLPLSQASFDGWLSDPAQMHDHANAWYSFYTKGEIVSMLLDLTIRRATNGAKSLDDVLLLLWEKKILEEDAVEKAVAQVADVGDFFARYVDGVEPLPYAELFAIAGVSFASTPRSGSSLGVKTKMVDGLLTIENVLRGGAGMDAGLLPNDELLSLDGTRTNNEAALDTALRGLHDSAELVISRAGVVKTLTLAARPDPRPQITLRITEPSELRKRWLSN
jgi:predicted metalloprotease with PDZ domain